MAAPRLRKRSTRASLSNRSFVGNIEDERLQLDARHGQPGGKARDVRRLRTVQSSVLQEQAFPSDRS
jgi:hypothetical protein